VIVNSAGGQLPRRIHLCSPLVQSEENKEEPITDDNSSFDAAYTTQMKHALGLSRISEMNGILEWHTGTTSDPKVALKLH